MAVMEYDDSNIHHPVSLLFLAGISLLSFSILLFVLYRRLRTDNGLPSNPDQEKLSLFKRSLPHTADIIHQPHVPGISSHVDPSFLLEILPCLSKNFSVCDEPDSSQPNLTGSTTPSSCSECDRNFDVQTGKKKKKGKKKKQKLLSPSAPPEEDEEAKNDATSKERDETLYVYPFTSSSSVTQKKIKQQYDELMKSNESNGLTIAQVGRFADCLVQARMELQNKSEAIQRKFSITKTLLFKAGRSSIDRIRQQMNRLEMEQKRLEQDAEVYNSLQHQLKLSPAYKKMIELGENVDPDPMDDPELESFNISFEEFLAREKKDSFWQKNGRIRTSSA